MGGSRRAPARTRPCRHILTGLYASQPAESVPLTVAILDFDSGTSAGGAEIGKQATEAIAAMLSGTKGIKLVDRSSMAKTLDEHAAQPHRRRRFRTAPSKSASSSAPRFLSREKFSRSEKSPTSPPK